MQDREKKLAVVLAGVLAIAGGWILIKGWFLDPITAKKGELRAVQSRLDGQLDSQAQLRLAQRNLADWRYESLPPDPRTAQRLYHIWLESLARMSGMTSIDVTLRTPPNNRSRKFAEVPVEFTARATLEQLARFLYHFERVALLQRVDNLTIDSPSSNRDALLDVDLNCVGLALAGAPPRSQLFPLTTLSEPITAEDTTLLVETDEGFPAVDGIQLRIDQELVTVRKRGEGQWVVERGAEQTLAVAHDAGSTVELFPADRSAMLDDRSFADYEELIANSPFAKPSPPSSYEPELSPQSEQVVTRGTPWTQKMTLTGWDPDGGDVMFTLGEGVPPGMTIDPQSGELYWNPDKEIDAKTYDIPIVAKSTILSEQQVELVLPVRLREPNLPPTVAEVDTQKSFSGRPLTIEVEASDPDGDDDRLNYSLTGEVPTGASIDEQTGLLEWTPPLTLELGEYKLSVAVADSGDPQQTTTHEVTVMLEDDAALFTRLIGIFKNGKAPEVMLNNMTTGETTSFAPGGVVKAADVEGTIVAVEARHILLEIGSETFRLDVGDNLRQLTRVEPASASAPSPSDTPSS